MHYRPNGFTLVELLIVIVLIAILATISVVSYNGLQERARTVALDADLSSAAKQIQVAQAAGATLSGLPSSVRASGGNVLQLTQSENPEQFCINGYGPNNLMKSISHSGTLRPQLCNGVGLGSPVGGTLPTPPRNHNLAGDLSQWTLTGGVTYDSASGEIRLNSSAGTATSPLVRIDGANRCRIQFESYATQPSPTGSPQTQDYLSSFYYGADGVTPVANTSGHTTNGNAQPRPLNTWYAYSWNTPCGPGVMYVKFRIQSTPTSRTSDNRIRNSSITISD